MPAGPRPNPPADTIKVAISGTIWGHKWANVFWLEVTKSAPVTVNDLSALATALASAWNTDLVTFCGSQHVTTEVQVTYYDTTGPTLQFVDAVNLVGGQPSTFPDASAAYLIDWVISAIYRGGHPRTYLAGPNNGDVVTGGQLAGGVQTSFATHSNAFRNAVNAITTTNITTVVMGTVSFVHALAWRSPPVFRAYTSTKVNGSIGTIKRRIRS
jgi:hypothetical protein